MEDPPPYCTGPTDSAEPPLTIETLIAQAHAQRQGIPYESREQLLWPSSWADSGKSKRPGVYAAAGRLLDVLLRNSSVPQ